MRTVQIPTPVTAGTRPNGMTFMQKTHIIPFLPWSYFPASPAADYTETCVQWSFQLLPGVSVLVKGGDI